MFERAVTAVRRNGVALKGIFKYFIFLKIKSLY